MVDRLTKAIEAATKLATATSEPAFSLVPASATAGLPENIFVPATATNEAAVGVRLPATSESACFVAPTSATAELPEDIFVPSRRLSTPCRSARTGTGVFFAFSGFRVVFLASLCPLPFALCPLPFVLEFVV